jgi:predicted metal-binding membrane protein
MDGMAMGQQLDFTAGMTAPLFLVMWVAMMIAMMFPASAPMIVAYARSQSRQRERGRPAVSSAWFVAPYVAVWLAFGLAAFGLAAAANSMAADIESDVVPRAAGGLMVLAGIYQLTPIKRACLGRCRTPLSFMLTFWRDGRAGALRMGLRHGLYCVGCCWVLFLLLIPLGIMNIAAMLAIAALVFAEKALPIGARVATVAAVVLVGYGLLAMTQPQLLPTTV